jgi:citrate lyase subunit beta/citryl-CoA lyase
MITGLRRSSLYVPGDSARMLEKSSMMPADMVILNLEDGIAWSKKDEARANVLQALKTLDFGRREVVVRVNSLASEVGREDLSAVVPCHPDGICLPKVEDAREIQAADVATLQLEVDHGIPEAGVKLHAMIESACGLLNATAIARASQRMSSLMFGSADYTKDLRCQAGEDRFELWFALQVIVVSARAGGIDAIDAPCFDVRNGELLNREATQARRLGYDGKSAIHPSQLEPINTIFDVTPEEIVWAESVLAELNGAESRGKALTTLAGQLIENPHRTTAERILRRSRKHQP